MNRLGPTARLVLVVVTISIAIVGGSILGAQALLNRLPQPNVASARDKESIRKIGTERPKPPPLVQTQSYKPAEVPAPAPQVPAATQAPTIIPSLANMKAKEDGSDKSSKTKEKPRRAVPKLTNEAKEAHASGHRPSFSATYLHGAQ